MNNNRNKPEILAPAGGMDSIYAAVRCGADGVYVGGKNFSARANAVNFSAEELKAAAEYCHLHGVKIYRAMNTVIFDSECEEFADEVRFSAQIGIDGLIIQDMGAAAIAREIAPQMPRHASTQLTVHTPLGAEEAAKAGFCRVVPARELSLEEIRRICETGVETEVFVHGAQCMCLSGQCYMSALIGSRSANRGQCAQACRLPFSGYGRKNDSRHDLSLKDMSLVKHTQSLIEAGAASFKIEGRMKRPEYTAAAVTALRNAADGVPLERDMQLLEAIFSRSGFTDGYLTGKTGAEMFGFRRKEDVVAAEGVISELAALYKTEKKIGSLSFSFAARENEPSHLTFSTENVNGEIVGNIPEAARNRPMTEADVIKQLSKLGDTPFTLGSIDCDISGNIMLPASELNRMRREAASLAAELETRRNTPVYTVNKNPPLPVKSRKATKPISFRIISDRLENVKGLCNRAELIILPIKECERLDADSGLIPKTAVSLPVLVSDEERLLNRVKALHEKGFSHFISENFTHTGVLKKLDGISIHGGTGMNITNSYALRELEKMGFEDTLLSFELRSSQISALKKPIPTGIFAYGRLPLMTVKNCPIKASAGCGKCTHSITDRTGRNFPVKCTEGYARIYNCDVLETSDRLDSFSGISFAVLDMSGLDKTEAEAVFGRYERHGKPEGSFTRGLYSRGVL